MLDEWREQYNGYRFAPYPGTPSVYNPFTLIRGLDTYSKTRLFAPWLPKAAGPLLGASRAIRVSLHTWPRTRVKPCPR